MSPSSGAIIYLYHHIVLPPKLPQQDDFDALYEKELCEVAIQALQDLSTQVTDAHLPTIRAATATVSNLLDSRDSHGDITEVQLNTVLTNLTHDGVDGIVPLEVKAQNAGVLISRQPDDVVFEVLELAPTNEAAMRAPRLTRTFPSLASRISIKAMNNKNLRKSLAGTLAKMGTQSAPGFQPQARKNGKLEDEDRDTTDPGIVTDFLLNVITALGETTEVKRISKSTREDVLWSNCNHPWRRAPLWLLLRVSLQLLFVRKANDDENRNELYKAFLIFMLARLLDLAKARWTDLGTELVHNISAKLVRRIRKFETSSDFACLKSSWEKYVEHRIIETHAYLDAKWQGQVSNTKHNVNITAACSTQPNMSLDMFLPELDEFLSSTRARKHDDLASTFQPSSQFPSFPAAHLPSNIDGSQNDIIPRLAALEKWVEHHLKAWIALHIRKEATCGLLRTLIETYFSTASSAYKAIPVSLSTMYLTIIELWVACDKSACTIFPMLHDYSPEICLLELQCLALPLKTHMERLHGVERYLQERTNSALKDVPSIYRAFGHSSSFAVKYYDQSQSLKDTLMGIEHVATQKREQKLQELRALKSNYERLMNRYASSECEEVTYVTNRYHGYTDTRHSPKCGRCAYKRQADALNIDIYEWPLSPISAVAKATVFELKIPQAFSDWRDTCVFVIHNVLKHQGAKEQATNCSYTLDVHRDIRSMLSEQYSQRRIILLSDVKPYSVTHRKHKKKIPLLTEDDVCFENALRYMYWDKSLRRSTTTISTCTEELPRQCMYHMPSRSKALTRFMYRPHNAPDGLPANEVLASLSDCPLHLSIGEYKALATIPIGRHIIWSNIVAQIATSAVDFTKVESQCMILQTFQQTGLPCGVVERTYHCAISQELIGSSMLDQLKIALCRLSENWESWRALASFSLLARRISSLTTSLELRERVFIFLSELRSTCFKWVQKLKQRATISTDDGQRAELYSRATEIALVCTGTYDVEEVDFDIILRSTTAITMLIQSSITIQENHNTVQSEYSTLYSIMLQSHWNLMYRLFDCLRKHILQDGTGLCDAVTASWAAFQPLGLNDWKPLKSPQQHWLTIASGTLVVHFDLLTAELLINGSPLARLPKEFMQHAMYAPLFSKSSLEVVPSDEPGFKFSAKSLYHDYKLHFGMNCQDMLVLAVNNYGRSDLVPARLFQDRLPRAFITNFVHWYDHSTAQVVFRPREDSWSDSSHTWRLTRDIHTGSWRMTRGSKALVDIRSKSALLLSKTVEALEDAAHIHIIFDTTDQIVDIEIPRLQLAFYIEQHAAHIRSRQFRGMFIDHDQNTGCLVGLVSKIVLSSDSSGRTILVPVPQNFTRANIGHSCTGVIDPVQVRINRDKANKIYAYALDYDLGRIIDTGDLESRLLLAYLHALTSSSLPDPLTKLTGTEAALQILQSAAVRSFNLVTHRNVDLLALLAGLSPTRKFYPTGKRVMQNVIWDKSLPAMSQHADFRTLVTGIFDHAVSMQIFHKDHDDVFLHLLETRQKTLSDPHLDERCRTRSSAFLTLEFGAEHCTAQADEPYKARCRHKDTSRGRRAFEAATLILRDDVPFKDSIPNLKDAFLRLHFGGAIVEGVDKSFKLATLSYDSKWLGDTSALLRKFWCSLHEASQSSMPDGMKYDIFMWISTMAYAESADMTTIQGLVALFRLHELAIIAIPPATKFNLSVGNTWKCDEVTKIIRQYTKSFDDSTESRLPKKNSETEQQHLNRINTSFKNGQEKAIKTFAIALQQQWPVRSPTTPTSKDIMDYLDGPSAMVAIKVKVANWYNNQEFLQYLDKASRILARQNALSVIAPRHIHPSSTKVTGRISGHRCFAIKDIFASVLKSSSQHPGIQQSSAPDRLPVPDKLVFQDSHPGIESSNPEKQIRLEELCKILRLYASAKTEKEYVEQLHRSCAALEHRNDNTKAQVILPAKYQSLLQDYFTRCQAYFVSLNGTLFSDVLDVSSLSRRLGLRAGHLARLSPTFWLSQLHRDRFCLLSEAWKTKIIEYGLAVTELHRATRLLALVSKPIDLHEELLHVGHSNWDPRGYPETLLLEAENGIMVREEQEFIASHMRTSTPWSNTVLQLLMGGGKSSTIVPILAAYLADKHKLVRVIIGKAQSQQMLHMLVSRLGGLLNRRIYHMPFSRNVKLTIPEAKLIRVIYEECVKNRGILLIQPEHILSFKLMAIESLATDKMLLAHSMLDTQEYFDRVARDIVDECDEVYSTKFELIYTMGSQESIDFAPERWLIIQQILAILPRFAMQVQKKSPEAIDMQHNSDGKFGRIRFLRNDAADAVLGLLAKHIIDWGLAGLPTRSQSDEVRAGLLRYITDPEPDSRAITAVEDSIFWTDSTKFPLLLVRGLIAGGVLRFAFSTKRWRVNFGLDSTRSPPTSLAVPYRSKDSPSPRSEFSHPEVIIILTLLSHYYGGLTDEQLFDTLAHVLHSDQAAIHYEEFIRTAASTLPAAFRQLSGISIRDRHQCIVEVFPHLRHSKNAIDYFLSHLVFPKQCKQFPQKLSASGWDLGAVKAQSTTGFSGTNDTLHLLPLDVKHLDLPSQSHTNAQVLAYLLQDETQVKLLPSRTQNDISDGEHLLRVIEELSSDVRVVLDCGASILELNNCEVARTWLQLRNHEIQAVVYFEDEQLSVLDRAGRIESFQTSPYAKQLDTCIVYLDEAHTRGTDLKLPRDYRAAVTLGAQLTKDRLTQACMRLRKLGHGQSVTFIVPEEIATKIRELTKKLAGDDITVNDVICWSISETWQDLKRSMPLWAVQGHRFESHRHLLHGANTTRNQAQAILEDEAQGIEARYKPRDIIENANSLTADWDLSKKNISQVVSRCRDFEAMGFGSAALSEEQERELAPEIEQERQVERPPRMVAERHTLHPGLTQLARTGQMTNDPKVFMPAFEALHLTSAASLFDFNHDPSFLKDLLVTADFMRTVKIPNGSNAAACKLDSFQRPVQFVLSVLGDDGPRAVQNLLIISPFEANQLLPMIRKRKKITLHLFAPRSNANFASLDELILCNVGREFSPRWVSRSLTLQLNLFAGSLYLRSLTEFNELCDFLGLLRTSRVGPGQQVHADGFIDPPAGQWGLRRSPVPFLRALLMNIRREGEGVEKTHLGKLLNGVQLEAQDFTERVH
ncbi:hypothetical protein ACN47E_005144 [Coniothyrium glycines]